MFFSPAYQTVVILTVLLVFIFLLLLFYTFWTRIKKEYWKKYKRKFDKHFLPLLLDFSESAFHESEADILIKKLSKRKTDIRYFLELLNELTEILKGEELEKIGWIIRHPLFFQYYCRKLFSYSIEKQLLSCIYFKKSGFEDQRITTRLIQLSKSANLKLAYGASQTLQSSPILEVRKNALIRFFKRKDSSDLMSGELVHLFYKDGQGLHEKTTNELKNILLRNDIPESRKNIIVLYFSQQNFFEFSFFLLEYLRELSLNAENKPLILALIEALGTLEVLEAEILLRVYAKSEDQQIRLASISALSQLGGDENLEYIYRLLTDMNFSVRKKVIEILVQHPETGHFLLENFLYSHLKLSHHISTLKKPSSTQLDIVRKISSITTGIRILSAKSLYPRRL